MPLDPLTDLYAHQAEASATAAQLAQAAIEAMSPGGVSSTDVQVFTAPGTWIKPAVGTYAKVFMVGGGGGAGSGEVDTYGNTSRAGCGGGGGGQTTAVILLSALGATETVVVGDGGQGAASVGTVNTAGGSGTAGTTTTFAGLSAGGGGAGTNTAGGAAGTGTAPGSAGCPSNPNGDWSTGQTIAPGGCGGGGGGGVHSSVGTGWEGGWCYQPSDAVTSHESLDSRYPPTANIPGGFGLGGSINSEMPGRDGLSRPVGSGWVGGGGSGGAGSKNTNSGNGGNGGRYGGGGGGGGGTTTGHTSGAGGNGGPGICIVITQ